MKANQVKVGQVYAVKVEGKVSPVRITGKNKREGWDGANLDTGMTVRIRTVRRLIRLISERGKTAKKRARKPEAESKQMSILDAAVRVLEERDHADGPLSCGQMVERMTAAGYWSPSRNGKTPAATLCAAILRELKKGEDSRIDKVGRGRFSLSLKR